MNELVKNFMEQYKAKVEADGQEAAHAFVDAELLPSLTGDMDDEAIKAFQEALDQSEQFQTATSNAHYPEQV